MKFRTERQWLPSAFIVLTLLCLFFIAGKLPIPANAKAQLQPGDAKGGVLVIPVQIERDSYGLAMVDTVAQTMWIYELNSRGPVHNRLRLLAARSWRYDKLLQQYNTAEPKPEQVKKFLEDLGRQQDLDVNVLQDDEPNDKGLGAQ